MMGDDTSYDVPARADGFTPLIDEVVRDLGTTAAVVYGLVDRHCRMYRHVCDASQATMATLSGLGKRTIRKWLAVLEKEGYILDVTDPPDSQGVPRAYVPTGKVVFQLTLSAGTPAPNAGGAAPNAGVPRHLMPPTPAPNATKDTIKTPSKTPVGNNSSSSESPAPNAGAPNEEEDDIPFLKELLQLGMRRKDAEHWLPIVGAENVPDWLDAVKDKGNPAGYLLTCWRNGDLAPPARPQYEYHVTAGKRRKVLVNPPVVTGWRRKVSAAPVITGLGKPVYDKRAERQRFAEGMCPGCMQIRPPLCPVCGKCDDCCTCGVTNE
jgi:hypothetical protein